MGAARSAVLLAIRERELGTEDSGYLRQASDVVASLPPPLQAAFELPVAIADTLPARGAAQQVADDVALRRNQIAIRNRDAWTEHLRTHADDDPLAAYLWLSFNCAYVRSADQTLATWVDAIPSWRDTPLLAFKAATCGGGVGRGQLERLLADNPRFKETHYFAGLGFAFTGRIDEAMDHLLKAYDWRHRWPAVTNSLGGEYIALEDFDKAIEFFDRTLDVVPDYPDALLSKIKAQTYAGRYTEALVTVDRLLALARWLVGDARYWRALNESQLGRLDEAWEDIELAAKQIVNAEVPKLAGIIAYRRKQIDVARERFELARTRSRTDCETGFYLGVVLAEQGVWTRTADVLVDTIACFDRAEATLNEEIANIRASTQPEERRRRQIAKREQQIASNRRMVATSRYNTAVSYFNTSRKEEARAAAEKLTGDEQYGNRARDLLARIR